MEPFTRVKRQLGMSSEPSEARPNVTLGAGAPEEVGASAERDSFDGFYTNRWGATVRLVFMVVSDSGIAEEIAQEAFIRVHSHWDTLDSPDAFLRTVTMNLCRSQLRRGKLEQQHAHDRGALSVGAPELDETWLAISRLPFRQRAVLALKYYADLPEAEIASAAWLSDRNREVSATSCARDLA